MIRKNQSVIQNPLYCLIPLWASPSSPVPTELLPPNDDATCLHKVTLSANIKKQKRRIIIIERMKTQWSVGKGEHLFRFTHLKNHSVFGRKPFGGTVLAMNACRTLLLRVIASRMSELCYCGLGVCQDNLIRVDLKIGIEESTALSGRICMQMPFEESLPLDLFRKPISTTSTAFWGWRFLHTHKVKGKNGGVGSDVKCTTLSPTRFLIDS